MERKKSPLSKFFDVIDIMEDILCGGTLVCLLFVVLLQVGSRLVGITLNWTEETTRFFFLWMMFLAVAAGFNRAESSRVVVLVQVLPRPIQMLCTVLYYVVSIAFFIFMAYYGFELTMQKFAFNEMATAIAIPMGAIMICVPLCGVLGVIGTIQSFLKYPHKVEIGGGKK
ncbi:TRAP transporter small permease [Flintibacter porci]|uniref:TRAP transporter small permease n=1 Tax=Flintibacter porci TaxID=3342383 RepID=UPI003F8A703C